MFLSAEVAFVPALFQKAGLYTLAFLGDQTTVPNKASEIFRKKYF